MNSKIALLTTAVLITGCSSVPTVSTQDAEQVIAAITAPGASKIAPPQEWIQPVNKKEACKIFSQDHAAGDGISPNVIWDGACKDGYAFGLGREFSTKTVSSGSWIATYSGGRIKPTYHSSSDYEAQSYSFGNPDQGISTVGRVGNSASGETYLQAVNLDTGDSSVFKGFSVASGEMIYGKKFPSGYIVLITTPSDPTSPLARAITIKKNNIFYFYGIATYRNGTTEYKKIENSKFVPAQLPTNYLSFLNSVTSEISSGIAKAEQFSNASYNTVARFKNGFCTTGVKPGEPAHYRDICTEQGDLTSINSKITSMIAAREARFSQASANQRQNALQAAQIQAINEQTQSINNQALNDSLNSLNNSLRQQQTNNLYQNNYQAPAAQSYEQRPTYDTTCYNLGVVVRCNTR